MFWLSMLRNAMHSVTLCDWHMLYAEPPQSPQALIAFTACEYIKPSQSSSAQGLARCADSAKQLSALAARQV